MRRALIFLAAVTTAAVTAAVGAFAIGSWPLGTEVTYDVPFDPRNFGHPINNKYFAIRPGTTLRYEKKTRSGGIRVEIEMTGETRQVMGVTVTGVRDREWVNDQLIEDTTDWYAQDKDGNVWYFGETVANYKDGRLISNDGSWGAGVNDARPGIVMPADPKVGQTYRQEYYKDEAEDMGTVLAIGRTVAIPHGVYDDCIQIRDWSRLEWGGDHKYFCSGVGFLALAQEWFERLELVGIDQGVIYEQQRLP